MAGVITLRHILLRFLHWLQRSYQNLPFLSISVLRRLSMKRREKQKSFKHNPGDSANSSTTPYHCHSSESPSTASDSLFPLHSLKASECSSPNTSIPEYTTSIECNIEKGEHELAIFCESRDIDESPSTDGEVNASYFNSNDAHKNRKSATTSESEITNESRVVMEHHVEIVTPAAQVYFPDLIPITPKQSNRYSKDIRVEETTEHWHIEALDKSHLKPYEIDEWETSINPDGRLYFYRPGAIKRENMKYHYVTEENLCERNTYNGVRYYMDVIDRKLNTPIASNLPSRFDIVFEKQTETNDPYEEIWCYYIVNHCDRTIHWFETYDASWIAGMVDGFPTCVYMKQWFVYEYWNFMAQFPALAIEIIDNDRATIDELSGIFFHGFTGLILSDRSTMTLNSDQCRDLLNVFNLVKDSKITTYTACSISDLMSTFAYERFMNFYGHQGSRIELGQSVRGPRTSYRTLVISFLSPALFFAPDIHLRKLGDIWVDKIIVQTPWKVFTDNLKRDWEQFVENATVILATNVAFLAIPNINPSDSPELSIYQIPSLLSTVASLGCIIIGLLLIRQHRTKATDTATEAAMYLRKWSHRTLGLEILAILYSLPYALLMWSVLSLVIAIAIVCFKTAGLDLRLIFGVIWFGVASLVGWAIFTGWEQPATSALSSLFNWIKRWMGKHIYPMFQVSKEVCDSHV